ncbi:glycosyltransferase [Aurantiacibacter hainanensis]|uniref:glycosyltransferase n=1 Tax=Aurantiacibacter hainanensis TaxID=3076114 RepID=UPI0030C758A4
MNRICLISPGHLSTNPRLVKEAVALKEAGFEVSVIHGRYQKWGTEHDVPIARQIGKTSAVPFGPVETSPGSYFRQNFERHCAKAFLKANLITSRAVESAHHPIARDLATAALAERADLYIAHYVAALSAAARAAHRHGAVFAFDAEDYHLGDLPDLPEHDLEKKIIRAIEGRYLPRAAYVTAASPMIAEAYAVTYGIELPTTVLNVFPRTNGVAAPSPRGTAEPAPSLYWFSQTIGPGRGLEVAINAISRSFSKPHLYLRGAGSASYRDALHNIALRAGVADRLHFLAPAAPETLERLGAAYDLAFSGETGFSENNQKALANKLFSYVLGGLPILASDTPAHQGIIDEFGPAMSIFSTNDPEGLAKALDDFLLNPARLASAREHAWRLGQDRFNWEVEQIGFLKTVKSALARRKVC